MDAMLMWFCPECIYSKFISLGVFLLLVGHHGDIQLFLEVTIVTILKIDLAERNWPLCLRSSCIDSVRWFFPNHSGFDPSDPRRRVDVVRRSTVIIPLVTCQPWTMVTATTWDLHCYPGVGNSFMVFAILWWPGTGNLDQRFLNFGDIKTHEARGPGVFHLAGNYLVNSTSRDGSWEGMAPSKL